MEAPKTPIGFIGCGFVGGTWIRYLEKERGYKRRENLFLYDPPKGLSDDVNRARIVVVAVPSPMRKDGSCDLSILEEAVAKVEDGRWIVIRSTIPPGTTARLQKKYPKKGFIFIPEFLTEVRADEDFRNPDRIIIAPAQTDGRNFRVVDTLLTLLPQARALQVPDYPDDAYNRLEVTSTEAEMAKYAGNNLGAWKVAFAELFSTTCILLEAMLQAQGVKTRVDGERVLRIVAADYRIGPSHLKPKHGGYRGFGGYCFIKDTYAFLSVLYELLTFYEGLSAPQAITNLLSSQIDIYEAILYHNRNLLALQGLTEEETMTHSEALQKLIASIKLKDIPDYLAEMDWSFAGEEE